MQRTTLKKNKIECAFATSDNKFTLGFAVSGRPKSLLKGNELEASKTKDVDLIFRKTRSNETPYSELIYGKKEDIIKYKEKISDLICQDFLNDN